MAIKIINPITVGIAAVLGLAWWLTGDAKADEIVPPTPGPGPSPGPKPKPGETGGGGLDGWIMGPGYLFTDENGVEWRVTQPAQGSYLGQALSAPSPSYSGAQVTGMSKAHVENGIQQKARTIRYNESSYFEANDAVDDLLEGTEGWWS